MKLEFTATLDLYAYSLDDLNTTPRKVYEEIYPKNCIRHEWIPQTTVDAVWLWFEFNSIEEKEEFLDNLPVKYQNMKGFIRTKFTQKDLDCWVENKEPERLIG